MSTTSLDLMLLEDCAEALRHPPYHDGTAADARLTNALKLVADGAISKEGTGYRVQGRTRSYVVGEACGCEDATKRKNPHCYHKIATILYADYLAKTGDTMSTDPEEELALPMDVPQSVEERMAKPAMLPEPPMPQPLAPTPAVALAPAPPPPVLPLPLGRLLRPLHAILADLRKPLPESCIATFKGPGNTEIDFLNWHVITHIFNTYAPGWYPEIVQVHDMESFTITVKVWLVSAEGRTAYEGIGREEPTQKPNQYGDKARRAYAKAIKHAAQLMGVDWLQEQAEKNETITALDKYLLEEQAQRIKKLGEACARAGLDKQAYVDALMAQACVTSWKHLPVAMLHDAVQCVEVYAASQKEEA